MNTLQVSSNPKPLKKGSKSIFLLLAVMLVASFFVACLFGSTKISLINAFCDTESVDFRILFHFRLPRIFAAILSGAALSVSGVIIQAVLNNPMAAPSIIGVNSGAGLAAAVTVAVFPEAIKILPFAAFLGAMLTCLMIYAIAARTGAGRLTITLVGIAVGSVLGAGINTVKVLFPDSVYDAEVFMIGGFSGLTMEKLSYASYIIFFSLAVTTFMAKDIDVLSLGFETAQTLGVNVRILRFVLLTLAGALAGAAVSFAGLLGFVGLLVPHIMRKFVGGMHSRLIPACILAGAVLVLVCDVVSRVIFKPYEIPVGIILSIVGGGFFVVLVLFGREKNYD